jgi:glycerophosphoryl diester phosphodiesterase
MRMHALYFRVISGNMIVGHRGLGTDKHSPPLRENTIESLVRATQLPFVSGVEFDVQMLADGNLVVYHDFDAPPPLDERQLCDLTLPEVRSFVGGEFPALLAALAPLGKGVICEVKYPPLQSQVWRVNKSRAEVARGVVDVLATYHEQFAYTFVSSFDPDLLVEVKRELDQRKQRDPSIERITVIFNAWFGHENDGWDDHDFEDLRNRDPISALNPVIKSGTRHGDILDPKQRLVSQAGKEGERENLYIWQRKLETRRLRSTIEPSYTRCRLRHC